MPDVQDPHAVLAHLETPTETSTQVTATIRNLQDVQDADFTAERVEDVQQSEAQQLKAATSIQAKIIVLFSGVLFIVLIATSLVSLFYTRSTLKEELVHRAETLGASFGIGADSGSLGNAVAFADRTLDQIDDNVSQDILFYLVQNENGSAYMRPAAESGTGPMVAFQNYIRNFGQLSVRTSATNTGQAYEFGYTDPALRETQNVLVVETPLLDGEGGRVFIGMSTAEVNAHAVQLVLTQGAILLALIVTALAIAVFFSRSLVSPIRSLVDVSNRVGQGDLSQLASANSNDEIGVLAQSFNNTITRLRGMVQTEGERDEERRRREELQESIGNFLDVAMDIADGDLTKRGQVSDGVLGNVVDAINLMVEELSYVLKDVQSATDSVNQGAGDMFTTTDEIARSAQRQAEEAQRARSEVLGITESINTMAQAAKTSAEAAENALNASEQGKQAVNETLDGMQGIRREVQAIAKRIKSLGDRSLEISEIVETISQISKQTNLLALNAAIEASGAGEAGSRFAVVAEEVRKLADGSADATERVAALIKNVQLEVKEVIAGVEEGTREVEEGYRVATQAGQRLEEISEISKETAQFAQRISQSTQDQVARVEQVGQVVEEMAGISERSQGTVAHGREAAEKLQQLAKQLAESIARFRVA